MVEASFKKLKQKIKLHWLGVSLGTGKDMLLVPLMALKFRAARLYKKVTLYYGKQ